MTQSNVNNRNAYLGDGVEDTFDYEFRIGSEEEILVIVNNVAMTLSTDYTVTGVEEANGGTVVFTDPPDDGVDIVLLLRAPFTQLVDLVAEGPFDPETIEDELDKLTRLCLTLLAIFGTPNADEYLKWSQNGKELVGAESTDTGFHERFGPTAVTENAFTVDLVFDEEVEDTQYMVSVMTNWQTTWCIPDGTKATTGFTIEFGTAAPADAEIYARVWVND